MATTKATNTRANDLADQQRDKKARFIAKLAEWGIVYHACEAAGIHRGTAYRWYQEDEQFAQDWKDALEDATDKMEREALRRAVEGTDRPVYQGGVEVGVIREYSDTLMLQMLKANRPEKHRDRSSVELTGRDGGALAVEVKDLTDDELRRQAAAILSRSSGTGGTGEA